MSTAYITTHSTADAHSSDIFALGVSEKYTVSAGGDGKVLLWSNTERDAPPRPLAAASSGCHHLSVSDEFIAAVFFDGSVQAWDRDLQPLDFAEISNLKNVWACAISPQKGYLAVCTIGGHLTVLDLQHKAKVFDFAAPNGGCATCIDITIDGNFVAVGMDSGKVCIYNTESGNLSFTLPLHTMSPRVVKFSPLGSLVAVAGDVSSISLFSLNGGDLIGTLTGHTSWIFGLSWSETGEFLLSVSHDKLAKIWSLEQRACVSTLNDATAPLLSCTYMNKGWGPAVIGGAHKGVITAGIDKNIRWYREAAGS